MANEVRYGLVAERQEDGSYLMTEEQYFEGRSLFYNMQAVERVNRLYFENQTGIVDKLSNEYIQLMEDYLVLHGEMDSVKRSAQVVADQGSEMLDNTKVLESRIQGLVQLTLDIQATLAAEEQIRGETSEHLPASYSSGYDDGWSQAMKIINPLIKEIVGD